MTKNPCDIWFDLLCGKIPYISQFYAEFANNREVLVDHFENCQACKILVHYVSPGNSADALKKMSEVDFLRTIENMRDTAIAKSQETQTR